jgi:vitamin B12 transporter
VGWDGSDGTSARTLRPFTLLDRRPPVRGNRGIFSVFGVSNREFHHRVPTSWSLNLSHALPRNHAKARVAFRVLGALLATEGASWASEFTSQTRSSEPPIEVVVEAQRTQTRPAPRAPDSASSSVGRGRIEGANAQVTDVLRTLPSITVHELGGPGTGATASIRGGSAAETAVYMDGIRLNDDISGAADLSVVPVFLLDRVEIYRSHVPFSADAGLPGGAVFFEPRRPRGRESGASVSLGSLGYRGAWLRAGMGDGSDGLLIGLAAERATNRYPFENDHGVQLVEAPPTRETRRNADHHRWDVWLTGRRSLASGWRTHLVANHLVRERGIPRFAVLQSRQSREELTRTLGALRLDGQVGRGGLTRVESHLTFSSQHRDYADPLGELALGTKRLTLWEWRTTEHLSVRTPLAEWLRLAAALDTSQARIHRNPDDIPLGRAHRSTVRTSSTVEWIPLEILTIRANGGAECHEAGASPDAACDYLEETGRLSVTAELAGTELLASIGRFARIPTLAELYGVSGTVHGNRGLTEEHGLAVDAGFRREVDPGFLIEQLTLDVFVFQRQSSGLVAYRRTGQGFVAPYNVNEARQRGLEALLGATVNRRLSIETTVSLLDPRDTSPDRKTANDILPYRARLVVAPRIRYDWRRHAPRSVSGAGLELSALHESSRYADPAGLSVIPAQTTCNLNGYLAWFDDRLRLHGRVADVFDAPRTDVVGYPLPGRSAYLSLEARID